MDVIDFPLDRRRSPGPTIAVTQATVSDLDSDARVTCMHERLRVGNFILDLCPDSSECIWFDGDELLDPAEALAVLFGSFDLRASIPGLDAPGEAVLVYQPDTRRGKYAMRSLPQHRWVQAAPRLWLTHDGERMLMSPVDRLLAENLTRDL